MRRKLTLCLIFILVVVAMTIISFIKPNKVEAYTSCSADEAINWLNSILGRKIGSGQCVALVSEYYAHLGNSTPSYYNAYELARCPQPDGWQYIAGAQPQKGDILVYGPNSENGWSGHVAIYESDYATFHQNYGGQTVQRHTYKRYDQFGPYLGVVRPDFTTGSIALDSVRDGTTFKAKYDSSKNYMNLDGWAMSSEDDAFLQIYVDDKLAIASHLITRYYRPGVSTNGNVGYRVNYNYNDLSDGEHTLKIWLHSKRNQGNVIAEKKIKFNVLHVDMSVDTIKNGDVFYKYADTSKNTFEVNGYAVTKYKNSFVQFYLDDNPECFVAMHRITRGSYNGITGFSNPGYYKTINYSDLPLGEHTLKIALYESGVNQWLDAREVKFTIKEGPKYKLGDVDNNGEITVSDAIMVLQHVAKNNILTGNQLLAADVDKTSGNVTTSESITVSDAIKILQYVAKNINSFD